jgi:uncharacterized membrane protein (DUF2068 family)
MTNVPSTITPVGTQAGDEASKAKRRPFGLIAIIVLQLLTVLFSGLVLALIVFTFALSTAQLEQLDAELAAFRFALSWVDVAALVLTFVVNAVCAIGLWRRQRWAWFLTMLQIGVFMISDLYSYFTNSPAETYVWSMLLNVFMVFYLNQRDVQAVFLTSGER